MIGERQEHGAHLTIAIVNDAFLMTSLASGMRRSHVFLTLGNVNLSSSSDCESLASDKGKRHAPGER